MKSGSLIVIGTGIRTVGQMTVEALAWIRSADKVLHVVGDSIAEQMLQELSNGKAESLIHFYAEGKPRIQTYHEMVNRMLECVREGLTTCVALYGHPGVFAYPAHEAIRQARAQGYAAKMLPGISAEDCLFADLGVDPATAGCQSYESTDFLLYNRKIDPTSSVILWQIGVLGDWTYKKQQYDLRGFPLLLERLYQYYPTEHEVVIYEAAVYPGCEAVIGRVPLSQLGSHNVSAASTLYIPPAYRPTADMGLYQRLGMASGYGFTPPPPPDSEDPELAAED